MCRLCSRATSVIMSTPIDNMLAKVEPYEDDFEDGATTGWSNWGGTWAAAGGVLVKTNYGGGNIVKRSADVGDPV
jgi:hypothetical protein